MIVNDRIYFHTKDEENNVVINGINGAVDIIDRDVVEKILGDRIDEIDQEVSEQLFERGYIFKSAEGMTQLKDEVLSVYKESLKDQPIEFTILPTTDCNLKCVYCFQGDDKRKDRLQEEELQKIFRVIERIRDERGEKAAISLFGGEPLMKENYECVQKIFNYVEEKGLEYISITTNGVNVDHYMDLFKQKKDLLNALGITLDGPRHIHESKRISKDGNPTFQRILDNIEEILELGINITVRVNVDHENFQYVEELVEVLDRRFSLYPHFACYLSLVTYKLNKGENKISLYELAKEVCRLSQEYEFITPAGLGVIEHVLGAFMGREEMLMPRFGYCEATDGKHYAFSPDGHIYNCNELIGKQEYAIGRYSPEFKMIQSELDRWNNNSILHRDSCKECAISLICGGGCRIEHFGDEKFEKNRCSEATAYRELGNFISFMKEANGF